MRHLDRDGSLAEAVKLLEQHNFKTIDLGVHGRNEPLAQLLRKTEPAGIGYFAVRGLDRYRFVVGLVASRERLYKLLNVESD